MAQTPISRKICDSRKLHKSLDRKVCNLHILSNAIRRQSYERA